MKGLINMEKRQRPITYAEAKEAKKFAEANDKQIIESQQKINHNETTLNGVKINELPSGGEMYGKGSEVFFTPLSFGEMKYLSGSTLSNVESMNFFLNKIQANFDKTTLTYFDFYYITILIKLSTFGESNFNITYECPNCKKDSRVTINTGELVFEEIRVPLPAKLTSKKGNEYKFSPMTVGNYLELVRKDLQEDQDAYMASQMVDVDFKTALNIIKNELNGLDVNLLETIDVMFYHGVDDLQLKCKNKIDNNGVEEVCGFISTMPFQSITRFVSTDDTNKESFRNRINYGV